MLNSCRARVLALTFAFATIGLIVEFLMLYVMGFVQAWPDLLPHFLASVAGLYFGGLLTGSVTVELVCSGQETPGRMGIIGLAVAWLTFLLQISFGVAFEFSRHSYRTWSFGDYVFKPFFWIILFGAVPATVLGLIYARQLRKVRK